MWVAYVFALFRRRLFVAGGRQRRGEPSKAPRNRCRVPPAGWPPLASLRCLSNRIIVRRPQEALLRLRRRGSPSCGSYAAQLGVIASRSSCPAATGHLLARSNLLEQCSHRDAASGRLSLRASLRSPLRTFALKSSAPWALLPLRNYCRIFFVIFASDEES